MLDRSEPESSIHLRDASTDDLALLRHWDNQPHVIACMNDVGEPEDWQWETELKRNLAWREILIAEQQTSENQHHVSQPIGCLHIIDPVQDDSGYWAQYLARHQAENAVENHFRAIDIWIGETDCLNKGYGSEMMRQALKRCFAVSRVQAVLIDPLVSNTRAHRFYQRLGFQFAADWQFDDDRCKIFQLHRACWQG